eukprot:7554566-Pyramimonas_sp.AAC.1
MAFGFSVCRVPWMTTVVAALQLNLLVNASQHEQTVTAQAGAWVQTSSGPRREKGRRTATMDGGQSKRST